jgi:hypothetical protein
LTFSVQSPLADAARLMPKEYKTFHPYRDGPIQPRFDGR